MTKKTVLQNKMRNIFRGPVIALVILILVGILIREELPGQLIICAYGITALSIGVRSEETLKMAIVAFTFAPGSYVIHNVSMAQNFAEYAFLLLGFALVGTMLEERRKAAGRS